MSKPVWKRRRVLLGAVIVSMCWVSVCWASMYSVAVGSDPVAWPMPRVEEPDVDRLMAAVLHRVIDGDSVELFVNGRVVRYELAGADSPDIVPDDGGGAGDGGDGGDGGDDGVHLIRGSGEARGYLISLLDGEQLAVLTDPRRGTDARGRVRGYVYRMPDGLFVNLEMVRLGFARHARDPAGFNDAVMLWAQDRARDASKGVWAPVKKPTVVEAVAVAVVAVPGAGVLGDASELAVGVRVGAAESEPPLANGEGVVGANFIVYVTKYGTKYHTKDCQHVHDSGIAKTLGEVAESHEACKVCQPGKLPGD